MSTDLVSQFEDTLSGGKVAVTRTATDGFELALNDASTKPAVGAPLGIEGIDLDDTNVALDPTPNQLREAKTGVSAVGPAVADYGSIVVQTTPDGDEPVSLYPEKHVAVLPASDIVADMPAAFERLEPSFTEERGDAVIATGPSATADMGELVYGAHGPKAVHVVVLEDR